MTDAEKELLEAALTFDGNDTKHRNRLNAARSAVALERTPARFFERCVDAAEQHVAAEALWLAHVDEMHKLHLFEQVYDRALEEAFARRGQLYREDGAIQTVEVSQ